MARHPNRAKAIVDATWIVDFPFGSGLYRNRNRRWRCILGKPMGGEVPAGSGRSPQRERLFDKSAARGSSCDSFNSLEETESVHVIDLSRRVIALRRDRRSVSRRSPHLRLGIEGKAITFGVRPVQSIERSGFRGRVPSSSPPISKAERCRGGVPD